MSDTETRKKKNPETEAEELAEDRAGETHKSEKEMEPKQSGLWRQAVIVRLKEWWQWALAHKKISIPAATAVLLLLVLAVPFTRYQVLGLFLRQDYELIVVDSQTVRPVSSATVLLGGTKATTDAQGRAKLSLPVGEAKLVVSKQYYKAFSREVIVPIGKPDKALRVALEATGRPVPITVVNAISGKPIAGATISAEKTQAKTDAKGKTTLVVPTGKQEVAGTLAADGYSKTEVTVKVVTKDDPANTLKLAPAGKIYFLSNASGKIDVIKSDLDGKNRQTVLAGTGKEDKYNTILFASRDWKYIALLSKRDGGEYAKLFLIEAGSDKLTIIDEGDAAFTILGWSGDRLIYKVDRAKVKEWEPKRQSLKSYHVGPKKITALFDSAAEGAQYGGYASEAINEVYVLDQEVIFAKGWNGYYLTDSKRASLQSVRADGSQKKTIKSYANSHIALRRGEFGELYIQYYDSASSKYKYDEYHDGKVTAVNYTDTEFYSSSYPVYAVSPSGKKTLWSDYRDGKNVFFVGDGSGENGEQIGASEDFTVYGWFSDDYILLTRKGSEMRILPVDGLKDGVESALKISDYYKPNYSVRGYGYGYGG